MDARRYILNIKWMTGAPASEAVLELIPNIKLLLFKVVSNSTVFLYGQQIKVHKFVQTACENSTEQEENLLRITMKTIAIDVLTIFEEFLRFLVDRYQIFTKILWD